MIYEYLLIIKHFSALQINVNTVAALAGRLILMRIPMIITWGLRERLESA